MRPARIILCLMFLVSLSQRQHAMEVEEEDRIADKIDNITASPEYDWLHEEGEQSATPGDGAGSAARPKVIRKTADAENDYADCGYAPGTGVSPVDRLERGCETDTPGSRALDCGCGPVGSCGSGEVGLTATPAGYLLGAAGLAIALWIAFRLVFRGREVRPLDGSDEATPVDTRMPRTSEVPRVSVDVLMARAETAAELGDFKQAVGWSYLSGLGILHRADFVDLKRATTNREIVDSVRRSKGPTEAAEELIGIFEELFFGARQPRAEHWITCRRIVEEDLGTA